MRNNISRQIKLTLNGINIFLIIYSIIIFIFKDKLGTLRYPLNVAVFMLLLFFSILFLGYRKNKKTKIKYKINNIFIIISIFYLSTIYLAGNATSYISNEIDILKIIYLLLYVILKEILRYNCLIKCNKNDYEQYFITFSFIILDVLVLSDFSSLSSLSLGTFVNLVIKAILENLLLSYTSYKFGFYPCIGYAIIVSLFPIIAPIYPNLGNYLSLIIMIIYTSIIFYNISKPTRREEEETINTYNKSFVYYLERVVLFLIIIVIVLVSGVTKYTLSAIGSDSMYPNLKKGDAVIVSKLSDKERDELSVGMIVAFYEGETVITHRIISIEEIDGEEYIITKGDNNSTKDVTKKKKDDIIGIVKIRLPLIGYPSVEISKIKEEKE